MSLITTPNVTSITAVSTTISGDVTLVGGTNITLTPSGQQITIAASGGGSGITIGTTTITSGTASRVLYEGTGNVVQEDSTFSFDDTNNILYVPEVAGGSTTSSNLMVVLTQILLTIKTLGVSNLWNAWFTLNHGP